MNPDPITTRTGTGAPGGAVRAEVRPPGFGRLVVVELRKSVDTRAGLVLLASAAVLTVLPVLWRLINLDDSASQFARWAALARGGLVTLLPIVAILAMTGEWTQRTALTTFTLVSRRGRVFAAKLAAMVVLGVAGTTFALGCAAGGLLLAAGSPGVTANWGDVSTVIGGSTALVTMYMLMGTAFGLLLQQTTLAVAAFLLAPFVSQLMPAILRDQAEWIDFFAAGDVIATLDPGGKGPQVATSLTVWVLLPLAVGWWRALRRDVS